MKGIYVVYGLVAICAICEIARAAKRGAKLAFIRLVMDVICGGVAYFARTFAVSYAFENIEKISGGVSLEFPEEIAPVITELCTNLAGPFVMLVVFILLKIVTGIVFLIVQAIVNKKASLPTVGKKLLGALCGIFSAAIVGFVIWLPGRLIANAADDYLAHRKEINSIIGMVKGNEISASDALEAADFVSSYVMESDLLSDESKVKAVNYGISQANSAMKQSGNTMLSALEISEVDDMSALKEQVDSVMNVAKAMDDAGMLDSVVEGVKGGEGTVISEETVFEAISDEKTARALVQATETMENGGEMLANAINSAVEESSGGQLKDVLNKDVLADPKKNEDAIVRTLTLADTLKGMDEASFSKMSVSEKYALIDKIEELKSLGVVNKDVCDSVLSAINNSMR